MPLDDTRHDIPLHTADDTRLDIPLHTADDTRLDIPLHTEAHAAGHGRTGSLRPLALVLVLAAVLVTLLGARALATLGDASPATDDATELGADVAAAGASDSPDPVAANDADVADVDEPAAEVEPAPVDEGGEPAPGDGEGDGASDEPAHPCDALDDGRVFVVTPGEVALPVGTYAGELIITNCAEEAMPWNAQTLAPGVQLGMDWGMVSAGASVDLQFAVDPAQVVGASYIFTITVNEPGFATAVQVTVSRPILNPAIPKLPLDELQLDT